MPLILLSDARKLIPVVNYRVKHWRAVQNGQPEGNHAVMTIGRLAEETGVHFETIRYYQRLGLIPTPARPRGSVRRYGEDAVERLRFIKRAQALGFSLDEVKVLLELAVGEHCAETRNLAERKLGIVEQKIAELQHLQAALRKLIRSCGTGSKGRGCPIIDNLSTPRQSTGRTSRNG
jgi:MerR family transcriptional regulator, mercuric resistance operon regulatory protein